MPVSVIPRLLPEEVNTSEDGIALITYNVGVGRAKRFYVKILVPDISSCINDAG